MELANRPLLTPALELNNLSCDIAFKLLFKGLNVTAEQHLASYKVNNVANTQDVALASVNIEVLTNKICVCTNLRAIIYNGIVEALTQIEVIKNSC